MMVETTPCETCGQPMLVFEGFEPFTICSDCSIRKQREQYPAQAKAREWLEISEWLDSRYAPLELGSRLTVLQRLEYIL